MKLKTYGDWFTGFGGMTLGAIDAGLNVVFGAEYDPKIAEVYRLNIGDHIRVCNLLEVDVSEFPRVDVFHASPPCPNFSNAKTNGKETENDIALSAKVAEYIAYHLPDAFTLENVYQYRNSKSWQVIAKTLHDNGYLFNYWHVNMADYGVPQTRKRMIVIARRDGVMPTLPPATHAKEPLVGLFGGLEKWVSWYEAIEDLIPELPDCEFAPWQENTRRLSDKDTFMVSPNRNSFEWVNSGDAIDRQSPCPTVAAQKSINNFRVSIYGQSRQLTWRCIKRFCTFPDGHRHGDTTTGYGNAVPPLFAGKLYKHLLQQYGG